MSSQNIPLKARTDLRESSGMPNSTNSSETTAIQAAYEGQVQTLFKSLITNLGDQPISHQTDQPMCRQVHSRPQHSEAGQAISAECRCIRGAQKNCSVTKQASAIDDLSGRFIVSTTLRVPCRMRILELRGLPLVRSGERATTRATAKACSVEAWRRSIGSPN